jgi:hypothetical protein
VDDQAAWLSRVYLHSRQLYMTDSERSASQQGLKKKRAERRTILEDRITPPIEFHAPFGQLERKENRQ